MNPRNVAGPLILIAIGVLFLIDNLVVNISFHRLFSDYWPLVIIAVGLVNIARAATAGPYARWGHLAGGIVTVAVGSLFLIQELIGIGFGSTWPLLLIVIGGLGLLRAVLGPTFAAGRMGRPFRGGFPR